MLTFLFLSEGDVRVHKTASNAMGGGGVRKAIFIEQNVINIHGHS